MSEQVTDPPAELTGGEPAPAAGRGGAARDALVVLGSFLALGVVCGVLWWLLVDPAEFTKVGAGGAMGEVQLGRRFDADGWYVVLAALGGVLAGGALTWWRSRDYLLTTGLLVLGSALAALVMAYVGGVLGPGDPNAALAAAPLGAHVPVQLKVAAQLTVAHVPFSTVYLAWPVAVLAGSLMVLWSKPLEPEL